LIDNNRLKIIPYYRFSNNNYTVVYGALVHVVIIIWISVHRHSTRSIWRRKIKKKTYRRKRALWITFKPTRAQILRTTADFWGRLHWAR